MILKHTSTGHTRGLVSNRAHSRTRGLEDSCANVMPLTLAWSALFTSTGHTRGLVSRATKGMARALLRAHDPPEKERTGCLLEADSRKTSLTNAGLTKANLGNANLSRKADLGKAAARPRGTELGSGFDTRAQGLGHSANNEDETLVGEWSDSSSSSLWEDDVASGDVWETCESD